MNKKEITHGEVSFKKCGLARDLCVFEKRTAHPQDERRKFEEFYRGCFFVLKTGCQWRMSPECYGNWQRVYRRFIRWTDKDIWYKLFRNLSKHADLQEVMLDGTIVRSHACAAGYTKGGNEEQGLGRSKGGFTTKIHAACDGLGNPLKFIITGGNRKRHNTQAENLAEGIKHAQIIADKAYDSDKFRTFLQNNDCTPVIPSKKNRKIQYYYDEHVYKERHLIECFFGKIKQFRRIFSRFDKMKENFLPFIYFASTLIILR